MDRRYGQQASVRYVDAQAEAARDERAEIIAAIQDRALVYPVTVIDGVPVFDGAVSFPAILRAVEARVAERGDRHG